MGIWRGTGSTRLQNLAMRSFDVCKSTSSRNKPVGAHNRMGMDFASKFVGTSKYRLSCKVCVNHVLIVQKRHITVTRHNTAFQQ
eukprot:1030918-Pelagomonas_calceolata.AAC.2